MELRDIPSPTCSGQPPSGCFTTLLVSTMGADTLFEGPGGYPISTMGTNILFAMPGAEVTGRGGGDGRKRVVRGEVDLDALDTTFDARR